MTVSGLEWYWWLAAAAVLVISVPFKIRFMKWWDRRRKEEEDSRRGKWGDEE